MLLGRITRTKQTTEHIMKFSNGTEFRFGTPKYPQIWSPLFPVGFALVLVFQYIFPKAPDWISGIGSLMILAGLVVSLFGTIAERIEWEAKHKIETK
jgi:hypothetical protein